MFAGGLVVETELVDLPDRAALRVSLEGRRVLLKVDSSAARSRREITALRHAGLGGVGVPEVVWHDPSPPSLVALVRVEGPSLAAGADGCGRVGAQLRRLHETPPSGDLSRFDHRGATWKKFLTWWLRDEVAECVGLGVLTQGEGVAIRTPVQRVLDNMSEPPRRFIHGDLQYEHVINETATGRTVMVDWGDAGTGDPL